MGRLWSDLGLITKSPIVDRGTTSGFRASGKPSFLEFPSFNILPRDKNDREILPVLLVCCFSTEIYNWYFLIVYLFKIFRSTLILSIVIARSVPAMQSARSESWKYFDYIYSLTFLFTFIISLISFIGRYLTERHIMIFIVRVKLSISEREREKDLFYFSYLSYLITLSWSLVPISG